MKRPQEKTMFMQQFPFLSFSFFFFFWGGGGRGLGGTNEIKLYYEECVNGGCSVVRTLCPFIPLQFKCTRKPFSKNF